MGASSVGSARTVSSDGQWCFCVLRGSLQRYIACKRKCSVFPLLFQWVKPEATSKIPPGLVAPMGNCCGRARHAPQHVPGGKSIDRNKTQRLANWKATGVIALRDASLKEIPTRVSEVGANARTLDATNNRLNDIPPHVLQLNNLQRLLLANNAITAIPVSICTNLTSLKVLILDHNAVVQLPEAIGKLVRLERLAVASNALATLPLSLGDLQALKELDVSGNKIKVCSTGCVLLVGFALI